MKKLFISILACCLFVFCACNVADGNSASNSEAPPTSSSEMVSDSSVADNQPQDSSSEKDSSADSSGPTANDKGDEYAPNF